MNLAVIARIIEIIVSQNLEIVAIIIITLRWPVHEQNQKFVMELRDSDQGASSYVLRFWKLI